MSDFDGGNMKFKDKVKETVQQAKSELRPAFISSWFYTSVGILFGFLLLALQHAFESWSVSLMKGHPHEAVDWTTFFARTLHFAAFVLEHLGIGLIVAAIAVFFYEWGAHIKKTMELSSRLTTSIGRIEETKKLVERNDEITGALGQAKEVMEALGLTGKLYESIEKSARLNLKACLNNLFVGPSKSVPEYSGRPEYLRRLEGTVGEVESLVHWLAKLRKDNAWANDKYIEFITEHVHDVVGHNARAFGSLVYGAGKQEFKVPPTAAGMAARILAKQMEALAEGDAYDVISDLTSWQETQLDKLFNRTGEAVQYRDVKVRRVFNLLPYIRRGHDKPLPHNYRNILINHLRASETWKGEKGLGGYEIKILWPSDYAVKLRNVASLRGVDVATLHFGLFIHGNESVIFQVTRSDLSDMELSRQPRENGDAKEFRTIWAAASDFPAGRSTDERISLVADELERLRGRE